MCLWQLVPLVRFERTYYTPLFERGDFTNLSTGGHKLSGSLYTTFPQIVTVQDTNWEYSGAGSEIRTHTLQGLNLLTLPIGLYPHNNGAPGRIRTDTPQWTRTSKDRKTTNSITGAFGADCKNRTYFHGSSNHRYDHIS